jgi:WD40 repeat protein
MFQGSKSALFWDVTLNEEAFVLQERGLVFSPDGMFVANTRGIWNAKTGDRVATLYAPHEEWGRSVAFSPDARSVATGYSDGTARIWATGYQARVVDLQFPDLPAIYRTLGVHPIQSAAITPDGQRIAGAMGDGRVGVWDRNTGLQLWAQKAHDENSIEAIVVSPNGKLVASASKDQTARVWDIDGHQLAVLKGHTSWIVGLEFSPDSKLLVTEGYDKTARIWDPVTGTVLHVLTEHIGGLYCAHFSPTAGEVVTCDTQTASIWNMRSGKLIRKLPVPGITWASFSADGRYLVTTNHANGFNVSKEACVWETASGRKVATIPGVGKAVFGPDPKYLLTFEDRIARIRNWQERLVLTEFPEAETGEWSRNGLFVLTVNKFGQVRIWSATTGNAVMDLPGESVTENIAHFSPDGRLVVVTSLLLGTGIYGCEVCVSFDVMMKLAAQRVTRQLSPAEKTVYLHQETQPSVKASRPELAAPRKSAELH